MFKHIVELFRNMFEVQPTLEIVREPVLDEDWNWTLPEEYQG